MTTDGGNMKRIYLNHVTQLTHEQFFEKRKRVKYEHTTFFVNRFPITVYIRNRAGFIIPIEPRLESDAFDLDHFYICEQYQCHPDLKNELIRQARSTPNSMRQHEHKALLANWTSQPPNNIRHTVEVLSGLDLETLEANDGVVYLEDHDVVVMYKLTPEQMEKVYHPYSKAGYTKTSFKHVGEDNPHLRAGDFTLNIRIVDNHDQFGSRWVLIDDQPHCIVACKDEEVTDGVYVTYSKNLLNGNGPQRLLSDRFEFGDKKLPYKLYGSQQEALQNRQANQVRELEAKALAAESGLMKVQQERDNIEREAEHRQRKHDQEMEKLRSERLRLIKEQELYMQKHVGELLSNSRKNTAELLKYVPVVITSIATLAALFKNQK